jgi:hypothetical protein
LSFLQPPHLLLGAERRRSHRRSTAKELKTQKSGEAAGVPARLQMLEAGRPPATPGMMEIDFAKKLVAKAGLSRLFGDCVSIFDIA